MNGETQPAGQVIARFLTPGGAHIIVSGTVADSTLQMACEGCGRHGGPYFPAEHETDSDVVSAALRIAERHAEVCRRIPERLWP